MKIENLEKKIKTLERQLDKLRAKLIALKSQKETKADDNKVQ